MFVLELVMGLLGGSVALLADSLDMLGDTLVYGSASSSSVRRVHWQARSALLEGGIMAAFGLGVLGQAIYKHLCTGSPGRGAHGRTALVAHAANGFCLYC
jgi:Co/Zn/Cd efflux system component